jgi:hypothetical protein
VAEGAGMPFQKYFLRIQAGTAYWNVFSGINITNTTLSPTEFWITMNSGTYFL